MKNIRNFKELTQHLKTLTERRRVAVAFPHDASTQEALAMALEEGFIDALLVGDRRLMGGLTLERYADHVGYIDAADPDEACAVAVRMAREGKADVLMKGLVNTDNLLRAILSKTDGLLPQGRVLTHVTCAQIPGHEKLVFSTDVAVIPHPTAEQRRQQLTYLLGLCRMMGIEEPRVGLVNCTEKVSEKHFPFTVDYRQIVEEARQGLYGPCIVDGPLDLKTCFSAEALRKKGIDSPLEGQADAIIFPDIQAGNVFYKTITCFCHARTAAMLCGPEVPVVLPSRGDSPENKFLSLALASAGKA